MSSLACGPAVRHQGSGHRKHGAPCQPLIWQTLFIGKGLYSLTRSLAFGYHMVSYRHVTSLHLSGEELAVSSEQMRCQVTEGRLREYPKMPAPLNTVSLFLEWVSAGCPAKHRCYAIVHAAQVCDVLVRVSIVGGQSAQPLRVIRNRTEQHNVADTELRKSDGYNLATVEYTCRECLQR